MNAHPGSDNGNVRPPDVQFDFGHTLVAGREARQVIEEAIRHHPRRDDVLLAVSELVTNVVLHTTNGGSALVWASAPQMPVRLEVHDSDIARPLPNPAKLIVAQPNHHTGRGLSIVASVADQWGIDSSELGKWVWAEFGRSSLA